MNISVLSAGAAKGLVRGLEAQYRQATGFGIVGSFGAVGAMKEQLDAGAPCDAIILTEAQIRALVADGRADGTTVAALGHVPTAIGVCAGAPIPKVTDRHALRASLLAASAVYLPDPRLATAGIHFMRVLESLRVSCALRPYPNGAEAMQAMALAQDPMSIGCTQASEILYTAGVTLVAPLPEEVGLVTTYAAAVVVRAPHAKAAAALIDLLSCPATAAIRAAAGFNPYRDSHFR